ncbi:MAG TPA: hypothetical protein VFY71_09775, partial [Planctomycetota bacterium]|nr:hypothetical protein [Planctomycetota bacterium]
MKRPLPTSIVRLSALLVLAAAACLACAGDTSSSAEDSRAGDDMLAAVCYYDDGLRLALNPDAPDGTHCVGANVVWTDLNDLQFS